MPSEPRKNHHEGARILPERCQESFKPYFTTHQKGTASDSPFSAKSFSHCCEIENSSNNPIAQSFASPT
jgi:hypothetical protein